MNPLQLSRRLTSLLLTLGLFLAALITGPVARGVPLPAEQAAGAQVATARKAAKGRIKVVLTGTGSYTVTGKKFRKTASASKTFRVKPGRYRIKAPGASVKPAKVTVRTGKTVKVRVRFPAPPLPPRLARSHCHRHRHRPHRRSTRTRSPPAYLHTCGIDTTGKAWCWGGDAFGQVGDGNDGQANEYAPVAVAGGLTFTHLSAGEYNTCGIDTTGKAWCWGRDNYGQVGDGNDGQATEYAPVAVAGGLTFTHLSAGEYHICGIDNPAKPGAGATTTTGRSATATQPTSTPPWRWPAASPSPP